MKQNKPNFTPGPWKIMNDKNGYPLIFNGVDGFNPICRLEHKAKFDRKIADANLIAAAPEMYEALQDLINQMNELSAYGDPLPDDSKAIKALAKARGEL